MIRPPIPWSEEDDAELRRIYAISSHGAASAALKAFAERKGIDRKACRNRAYKLHLTRVAGGHRIWTKTERENLHHYAGKIPAWKIAKILGRSDDSVKSQIYLMGLTARVEDRGYTRLQIAELMGVDLGYTLRKLLRKFPIRTNGLGNFSCSDVQLWIWDHLEEFELRKFNQEWLKAILRRAA